MFSYLWSAMSALTTRNPIAIQQLMNETLFRGNAVASEQPVINDSQQPLRFWGANGKRILFLLDNPHQAYFSKGAEDAFLKTLAALKLSLDDVALVNYGKCGRESKEEIRKFLNPKVCVFLGKEVWDNKYTPHETFHKDEVMMLNTYTFEEMLNQAEKKRTFWKAIKSVRDLS